MGKLRSATGIDRLRILGSDKATGRGTALAAGQHISDDIYVEIITDARGFTATQLEISLSKSLYVLSQAGRSDEHTSEIQSLMSISYAVFCLKKKKIKTT